MDSHGVLVFVYDTSSHQLGKYHLKVPLDSDPPLYMLPYFESSSGSSNSSCNKMRREANLCFCCTPPASGDVSL